MTESIQGMENKNRMVMWMTLSLCLVLAIAKHADNAANVDSAQRSGGGSASLERKPSESYMIDLYNIMFDKYGHPRKGIATMDDDMSCFLPEVSSSNSLTSFTFDIREIKKDSEIVKANLIFPIEQPASTRSTTRSSPVDADDDSPPSPLNLSRDGWKSTDVTSKVKSWHKRRHKKNTIHVDRKSQGLDKSMQAPFLVVHSRSNIKHAKRSEHEGENETVNLSKRDQGSLYKKSKNIHTCRRKTLEINTKVIGFDKTILSPSKLIMFRCEGTCGAIFSTAAKHKTWHSRIQASSAAENIKQNGKRIKFPCCSPAEYDNVRLLRNVRYNNRSTMKFETITDLVVKSCGCF